MSIFRGRVLNRGQAMVEFVIVVIPLLLLVLGALQFALIYHAKITLNYAAFETARAGSLTGARMIFMENAFTRALAPLYTTPYLSQGASCSSDYTIDYTADVGVAATPRNLNITHVECARDFVRRLVGGGYARIVLVNPGPNSFLDFREDFESVRDYDPAEDSLLSGRATIPNDNLMYRDASPGINSEQSIQDANLIKVHVSLCYELMVPLVDLVIKELLTLGEDPTADFVGIDHGDSAAAYGRGGFSIVGTGTSTFGGNCANRTDDPSPDQQNFRGIPIYAQAIMRMHSPAVKEGDETEMACSGYCP
ncbi:MAG: TadE/TadG family type IV pilus assembly protein [Pseudomonadota bacterium]